MRLKAQLLFVLLSLLGVADASALSDFRTHPGFVDFRGLMAGEPDSSVEVFLHGKLLEMVAAATSEDDPDLARLLSGIAVISVQSFEVEEERGAAVREAMADMARRLEESGWETVIRFKDGGEQGHMYLRSEGDEALGLALMIFDEDGEVTFVNIAGSFDPADVGRLTSGLDIDIDDIAGIRPKATEGREREEER
jgi:hypothetical protein